MRFHFHVHLVSSSGESTPSVGCLAAVWTVCFVLCLTEWFVFADYYVFGPPAPLSD